MENSYLHNLNDKSWTEKFPGFKGKFVHTDKTTLAFWEIEQGSELPEHHHHHEQIVNVLQGKLEINMGGKNYILECGQVLTIPSEMPHSGKAITECQVLDVFNPARDDYR